MYCTEDCKCSLCRELRGFDYRREINRSKKFKQQKDSNFSMIKKAQSTFELNPRHEIKFKDNKYPSTTDLMNPAQKTSADGKHKVIIYFSDAYKPNSGSQNNLDVDHAKRLAEEIRIKHPAKQSLEKLNEHQPSDFVRQLKTVLEEKSKAKTTAYDRPAPKPPTLEQIQLKKQQQEQQQKQQQQPLEHEPKKTAPISNEKPNVDNHISTDKEINQSTFTKAKPLPSYIESIENNVINLKIEQNFKKASELVNMITSHKKYKKSCRKNRNVEESSVHELKISHEEALNDNDVDDDDDDADETASEPDEGFYYDWSFVQEWRSRPSVGANDQRQRSNNSNKFNKSSSNWQNLAHADAHSRIQVKGNVNRYQVNSKMQSQQPITTVAPKIAKEVALRPISNECSDKLLPTSPLNHHQRHGGELKTATTSSTAAITSAYNSPHIQCVSSSLIPERDSGPIRLPASPPTITQATPPNATIVQPNYKPIPHRAITGPTRLTVQSTPVKAQPPLVSSGLGKTYLQNLNNQNVSKVNVITNGESMIDEARIRSPITHLPKSNGTVSHQIHQYSQQQAAQPQVQSQQPLHQPQPQHAMKPKASLNLTRTHHHGGGGNLDFQGFHKIQECHSSSDENRSSGHASMSDTGHGSSSPGSNKTNGQLGSVPEDRLAAGVTNRNGRSRASTGHSKSRHRATPAKIPWSGNGLEDIKMTIQQLTLRSQTSTSTYSSLSAGSESSEPARRLGRYSSMETVNTNVTSADEFVWVDSHNRLVELQHPPWSQYCLMRVLRTGRCREIAERVSAEAVPRLGYLLTRALVRIAREIQRLSSVLGLCSKHEVAGAFKVVLSPALSDSCIKACLRAAAMFGMSGDGAFKQTKSARAGLQLPVGRFHRWMVDARLGKLVHEYAAIYLCAGFENLLEEIVQQSIPSDSTVQITAMGLEHSIAGSGDLWGLLQPFVHLNAGRIASGALTMPRWTSQTSIGSNHSSHNINPSNNNMNNSSNNISNGSNLNGSQMQEPCLLTTCVGSLAELKDLVSRAQKRSNHITMSQAALRELFYFMRCSQLEHNEVSNSNSNGSGSNNIQELCYERAYIVLPPLVEWLRVASAHSEYRHSSLIDRNDILQAARLLLPGVDCPPRSICLYEELPSAKTYTIPSSPYSHNQGSLTSSSSSSSGIDDTTENGKRATIDLAFRMMLTGIPELLTQAMSLVSPTTRYDTINHQGLTALMIAAIRNDENAIQSLLDCGANPNIEVPSVGTPGCPAIHPETQHWTAVTFAACRGNYQALRILLERGGKVEVKLSEEKCAITPLQAASGSGCIENVSLLLAHGAHAFLSTRQNSSSFTSTAQRGSYSAISVATAHGQRLSLRKLLSHPIVQEKRDVLSLEEMLAEGDSNTRSPHDRQNEVPPTLTKAQIRTLQEAMYHSAENNYLDITIELRSLGVPWTLHCWMHALAAAHELRLDAVIDQLLQDFLQVCPDDYSQQFVMECLPLLFNIFRYSKKEGTTLLLADIFSTCFGWEPIKPIKETVLQPINGSRIDPKFVNNPELSDVTFRVEGKIFYGHKIVLVTASPRLQSLLSSKVNEGNGTPTVQINDIRYHIFELVMQYLYSGGCNNLEVAPGDVLELMAAASFFQLEGLLRYTEARCADIIDIDNVVAMYIHAKVYNASKLMEYCQGFLLQNMVALLTYDDSVKRLLFAKKIPNHDVLSGLLTTLQNRIKSRRTNQQNISQNVIKPVPIIANSNSSNNNSSNMLNKSNNNLNSNAKLE